MIFKIIRLDVFTSQLYLFTCGPLSLPSFCIVLCTDLLIVTVSASLKWLHSFVIFSIFIYCLFGTEHLPPSTKHTAISSGHCLEYLAVVFSWENIINWGMICYLPLCIWEDGIPPVLCLNSSEILGNYLLV